MGALGVGVVKMPALQDSPQRTAVEWVEAKRGGDAEVQESERSALSDAVFGLVDCNGDGKIEKDEMRVHLLALGYDEASVDEIFGAFDLNSDGAISKAELRHNFEKYDYRVL